MPGSTHNWGILAHRPSSSFVEANEFYRNYKKFSPFTKLSLSYIKVNLKARSYYELNFLNPSNCCHNSWSSDIVCAILQIQSYILIKKFQLRWNVSKALCASFWGLFFFVLGQTFSSQRSLSIIKSSVISPNLARNAVFRDCGSIHWKDRKMPKITQKCIHQSFTQ